MFPPEWRGCPLSHFRGKDFCWHLPLPGGAFQDHQASQGLLHGGGWRGTEGKDEPAEGTEIQVEMDTGWTNNGGILCSDCLWMGRLRCKAPCSMICVSVWHCNEKVNTGYRCSQNVVVVVIIEFLWNGFISDTFPLSRPLMCSLLYLKHKSKCQT